MAMARLVSPLLLMVSIAGVAIAHPPSRPTEEGAEDGRTTLTVDVTRTTSLDGEWNDGGPIGRAGHTMIYDPLRDRMIVFGGTDGLGRNDVWVLTLSGSAVWNEIRPDGVLPAARGGHTAIYDPLRDRMLVFGGYSGALLNDVWALSLDDAPTWTQLAPAGTPPGGLTLSTATYDPLRDRMLVIGGDDGGNYFNDVWSLSLSGTPQWTKLSPSGTPPPKRSAHSAIYDPTRDRVVLFGGHGSPLYQDVWSLSLDPMPVWSQIVPIGTIPSTYGHSAIYDPTHDQMVVFGGINHSTATALTFGGTPEWIDLAPTGAQPRGRSWHTAVYDPAEDRMVVFGGDGTLGEVWELSLSGAATWTQWLPGTSLPLQGGLHSAIHDPVRSRMVVFGGVAQELAGSNTVWSLMLDGTRAWSEIVPPDPKPPKRFDHTAIYDPVRDRMIVFGGLTYNPTPYYFNDVWALSFAGEPGWTQLTPSGTPPSGRITKSIYDPVRDRMIVFGGYDGASRNDVWALSLDGIPAWTELNPSETLPSGRFHHTLVYDPVRDQALTYGGSGADNDVWALSLSGPPTWTHEVPGMTPPPRVEHAAIWDLARDRMVVFGGHSNGEDVNDVWALTLDGAPAWVELIPSGSPPTGRSGHTAIYDAAHDRLVTFGGSSGFSDLWELAWGEGSVSAPDVTRPWTDIELAAPWPTPSRGPVTLSFSLHQTGQASLTILDVSGRTLRQLIHSQLAPGQHACVWDGRDDLGRRVASGMYFVRLDAGNRSAVRRVVVLQSGPAP